ncbi:MAG: hypothetical protein ABJF23_15410 [Bryobacteraceae bacterium]
MLKTKQIDQKINVTGSFIGVYLRARWPKSTVHLFSNFHANQISSLQRNRKQAARPWRYSGPVRGHHEIEAKTQNRAAKRRQSSRGEVPARHPGIQASSLNAIRHGLLSKALVLSTESQEKFDQLLKMYLEKFQPQDGVETDLVYEMVAAKWRQQRVWMTESTALELEMDDQQIDIDEHEAKGGEKLNMTNPRRIAMAYTRMANNEKTLELLLRYETSFSRMHDRAVKSLFRLRENLNCETTPNPDPPPQPNTRNQGRDPEEWPPQPQQILTPESEPVIENVLSTLEEVEVVTTRIPDDGESSTD